MTNIYHGCLHFTITHVYLVGNISESRTKSSHSFFNLRMKSPMLCPRDSWHWPSRTNLNHLSGETAMIKVLDLRPLKWIEIEVIKVMCTLLLRTQKNAKLSNIMNQNVNRHFFPKPTFENFIRVRFCKIF